MNTTRRADKSVTALLVPVLLVLYLVLTSGFDVIPALGVFNAKRILELGLLLTLSLVAMISPVLPFMESRMFPCWPC